MKFWIFKCKPNNYDLDGRLMDPTPSLTWSVTKFRNEIKAGDIAFIWETGRARGIRGVLRIDSDPAEMEEMDTELKFNKTPVAKITYRVVATLTDRTIKLPSDSLRNVAGLQDLSTFTGFQQGTNFPVTRGEALILARLIRQQHDGKRQVRTRITREQYVPAYELGREVHKGSLDVADAIALLRLFGMNEASASFSIGNLRQMLTGSSYGRAMSVNQTRYFIMALHRDDGVEALKQATTALGLHLPYLRKSNHNDCPGLGSLLKEFRELLNLKPSGEDAINDVLSVPEGYREPNRLKRTIHTFARDPLVRNFVARRSHGRCEYCGRLGFATRSGNFYIETHHIISLGKDGPDTIDNVIALCPEHHRQAHYGCDTKKLEADFVRALRAIA